MLQASKEFRERVEGELMGALASFEPDLLFISAGFDGHVDDFYHYLTAEDYEWITTRLSQAMDAFGGRIISVDHIPSSSNIPQLTPVCPQGLGGWIQPRVALQSDTKQEEGSGHR